MTINKPRGRTWSPKSLQALSVAGLIAYALMSTIAAFAITGPSTHPSRELFPFFTWSLFSRVSDVRTEYSVLVLALDDRIFDQPTDMRLIDDLPSFSDSRTLGYKALQNLGHALRLEHEGVEEKRRQFESRFFGRHDVDYLVMLYVYNPLRRWHEGEASDDVWVIGRYHHKQPT
ncbi:MAG: hypothetical protein ACR2QF_18235 [Geminicoccaceae bacterium]